MRQQLQMGGRTLFRRVQFYRLADWVAEADIGEVGQILLQDAVVWLELDVLGGSWIVIWTVTGVYPRLDDVTPHQAGIIMHATDHHILALRQGDVTGSM